MCGLLVPTFQHEYFDIRGTKTENLHVVIALLLSWWNLAWEYDVRAVSMQIIVRGQLLQGV